MDVWVWIVIAAVALAVVAAAVLAWRAARRARLRETFGPEYERAVADAQTEKEAERELGQRLKRRDELQLRRLSQEAAERYEQEWEDVQARFVDDPVGATREADRLVQQVMSERGYPMDEFERRAELISVDHPEVVENYRRAHETCLAYDRGDATTEDLRQAMVHYRSLFAELLERREATTTPEEAR
ncbi:MAG: hypothetical protein ICV67_00500 [Thermoleophilia bacterium]|nr:hypothetical protein [Thermoleophilia bacterium]